MGVHGLWKLIEPSGQPVSLESLENKILAVDVSIWLHHFIKGFQDGAGAPVPNAHLLGIYHRVCKLLYFRIKPVFVFDGGVPALKKRTMELRNQRKSKNLSEADRIHKNLLSALVKHSAISKVLSEKTKAAINAQTSPAKKSKFEDDNLYMLPPTELDSTVSSSEEEDSEDSELHKKYDLHSIDTQSSEFKSLPVELRHEILSDLKETRKQSSWGRINEMPTHSDDFATYQMKRLLKRQSVQTALEHVEKEMGGHSLSLGELEQILKDQGVINNMKGNRIASDENTRFLLIKDIKQALEDAKKQNLEAIEEENDYNNKEDAKSVKNKGDQELDDDLAKAIALSLEQPSSSTDKVKKIGGKGKDRMPLSFLADFDEADFDFDSESSEEETIRVRLTPAQRYMMEYSNLTPHEIAKILAGKSKASKKVVAKSEKESITSKTVSSRESHDVNEEILTLIKERDARIEVVDEKEDYNIITESESIEDSQKKSDQKDVATDNRGTPNRFHQISTTHNQKSENNKVEVLSDSRSSNNDDNHNQSKDSKDEIEVMSDSGSSSNDDFLEVRDTNEPKPIATLEVIIKPDEEIEDDFFKDIFEDEEKTKMAEPQRTDVSNLEGKTFPKLVNGNNSVEKKILAEEETSTVEINNLIKNYTTAEEKSEAPKLSVEQLNEMRSNLRKEQKELTVARSAKERLAGNITDQMYQEAQDLLELFGVPYVIAPMEAEAQCAFLELINLTDGTITDDSDIWLFGGRTVYKNFFNQSKYVLEFKSERIQENYKLTREQMVLLAMLVGSDYTVGLQGVGPVTALEILAAFPPKRHLISGLAEFRSWFQKGKMPRQGRNSLRGKLKNVNFSENFPNPRIVDAYLEPKVETSEERFTWAKPDAIGLVDFAREKFGWTKTKTDDILNPVLKRLQETQIQKPITDYFKYQIKVNAAETDKTMSKRVKNALDRIGKGEAEDELEIKKKKGSNKKKNEGEPEVKKRRPNKKKREEENDDEEIKMLKETEENSKKRLEEIRNEVERQQQKINFQRLHRKEAITQKQKDKADNLQNKLKAIETFRKSKQGPGYVKKRTGKKRQPKADASYLSESGSGSD